MPVPPECTGPFSDARDCPVHNPNTQPSQRPEAGPACKCSPSTEVGDCPTWSAEAKKLRAQIAAAQARRPEAGPNIGEQLDRMEQQNHGLRQEKYDLRAQLAAAQARVKELEWDGALNDAEEKLRAATERAEKAEARLVAVRDRAVLFIDRARSGAFSDNRQADSDIRSDMQRELFILADEV